MALPLPQWFVQGHNVTLRNVKLFRKLPNVYTKYRHDNYNGHLNELNHRKFFKPQGRLPYSSSMIRYAYIYVIRHSPSLQVVQG